MTYSRPTVKLYRNGKLTEAGEVDVEGVAGTLYIGGTDKHNGRFWGGKMDEVILFSRALGEQEVGRLYCRPRSSSKGSAAPRPAPRPRSVPSSST